MITEVKQQIETVVGLVIGGGTTVLSIEQFINNSTPIIKYIGLCAGTMLTIVLLVRALKSKKKKR